MDLVLTIENVGDNGKRFIVTKKPSNFILKLSIMIGIVSSLNLLICIDKLALITILGMIMVYYSCQMHQESMTVLPRFGIEFEHIWFCNYKQKEFIMWKDIDTIIINEGFRMFKVHYYLAILPIHQRELYLPFNRFIPRLDILLPIYKDIKSMINKCKTQPCHLDT